MPRIQESTYDVIVMGGGLRGVGAALTCARAGLRTLCAERRPLLGWEAVWAGCLSFDGTGAALAAELASRAERVGGLANGRLDGPVLEIALDGTAAEAGLDLLYYAGPVAVLRASDRLEAVVVEGKAGSRTLHAKAFVDATDGGLTWQCAGSDVCAPGGPALFVFYMNGADAPDGPAELDAPEGVHRVVATPTCWPGEVAVGFEIPEDNVRLAREKMIEVIETVRAGAGGCADALVSHAAWTTFPLSGGDGDPCRHPEIVNLFGAGRWAGPLRSDFAALVDFGESAGRLVLEAFGQLPPPATEPEAERCELPARDEAADVLVCGGGTAGALAAIASAREGASTTLVECSSLLGGIGTGGGIHSYYHGVPGGLQDEVDRRVDELTPLFAPRGNVRGFHPVAKAVVLDQMAQEAGVDVVFDATVTGVETQESGSRPEFGKRRALVTAVRAAGPDGVVRYRARAFVDSTGDADVAARAGAPFTYGRAGDGLPHAFTLSAGRLSAEGEVTHANFDAGHCDPTDMDDLTRARRLGLAHFRRDRFTPEDRLLYVAPLLGVRQSRQILGEYRLTLADEAAARRFDDVIAYARSHYDNHTLDYENESDEAVVWVWLLGNWDKPIGCEIPYRCLLPHNVDGVLVACRALSLTQDAHHQMRMERDMQRIGEAAGIAAALSAAWGMPPRELPVREVQQRLFRSGALGPADADRSPGAGVVLHDPSALPAAPADRPAAEWIEMLSSEHARTAVWMAMQAGEQAMPALGRAARSEDEQKRFWASVALAMLNSREAAPGLVAAVENRIEDKADGHKAAPAWMGALVLLGRTGDARAVPAITAVLESPEADPAACIAALRALGRIGDPAAGPAVRAFLARSDPGATRALQVSDSRSPDVAESGRWQFDLTAAEALARMNLDCADLFEPYLDDERAPVRSYAERIARAAKTSSARDERK